MENAILPILLFVGISAALAVGMLVAGWLVGPSRQSNVKMTGRNRDWRRGWAHAGLTDSVF